MALKLRLLNTSKSLTPGELELINWNFHEIEAALSNLGANNPSEPGPGTPGTIPVRHDQLMELGDDDHLQYLLMSGRRNDPPAGYPVPNRKGQHIFGGTTSSDALVLWGNRGPFISDKGTYIEIASNNISFQCDTQVGNSSGPNMQMHISTGAWFLAKDGFGKSFTSGGTFRTTGFSSYDLKDGVGGNDGPVVHINDGIFSRDTGGLGQFAIALLIQYRGDRYLGHPLVVKPELILQPYPTGWGDFSINQKGQVAIGPIYTDTKSYRTVIQSRLATEPTLALRRFTGATANLLTCLHDNGSTVLSYIDKDGIWNGPIAPSGTSTFLDSLFRIADNTTPTKLLAFELSGLSVGTRTLTPPDADGTLMLLALAQSPTNKTFDNTNIFTIRDDRFTLQDNGDTTKQLTLQLVNILTNTTRTWTVQDSSGTVPLLEATQVWTGAQQFNGTLNFVNSVTVGGDMTFTTSLIEVDTTSGAQFTIKINNAGSDALLYYFDGSGNDYTIQASGIISGNPTLTVPSSGGVVVTQSATQALTAKSINGGVYTSLARTTSLATTNISPLNPSTAALYLVEVVLEITTAGGADRTVEATVGWTDNVGATTQQVIVPFAANATGRVSGLAMFRKNSGNITIASALAGAAGGAPTWNVHVRCLNLG